MTHAQRNAQIIRLIEEQTRIALESEKTARDTLIKEGIYTKKGKLRARFGGGKKVATAG